MPIDGQSRLRSCCLDLLLDLFQKCAVFRRCLWLTLRIGVGEFRCEDIRVSLNMFERVDLFSHRGILPDKSAFGGGAAGSQNIFRSLLLRQDSAADAVVQRFRQGRAAVRRRKCHDNAPGAGHGKCDWTLIASIAQVGECGM